MTSDDAHALAALTMDLADVRLQLETCAALLKGIQERVARIAIARPLVMQDVSGDVLPRED